MAFTGAQRRDKKCFYVFDDRFTCTIFSPEHLATLGHSVPMARGYCSTCHEQRQSSHQLKCDFTNEERIRSKRCMNVLQRKRLGMLEVEDEMLKL